MIILLVLIIWLVFTCKKENNISSNLGFLTVWLLFAFNYYNSDRVVYENMYMYRENYGKHEPLYSFLSMVFETMGMPYQIFYFLIATVCISILWFCARRFTEYSGWFVLFYLLWPFPIAVSSVRNTLAHCLVILALYFLISGKKRNWLKYIVLILVAGLIHYTAFVYLIFAVVNLKIPRPQLHRLVILLTSIGIVIAHTNLIPDVINLFFNSEKVLSWFDTRSLPGFVVSATIHLYVFAVFCFGYNKLKGTDLRQNLLTKENYLCNFRENLEMIYDLNLVSFMTCILYIFNNIFMTRIYAIIIVLNYFVIVEVIANNSILWKKHEKLKYYVMISVQMLFLTFILYGERYLILSKYLLNNYLF